MTRTPSRILVLGASGMLGNTLFRFFSAKENFKVFGSVRSDSAVHLFPEHIRSHLVHRVEVENIDSLTRLFADVRPDIVVNCVGVIKQLSASEDPLTAIPINSMLPHRLANLCALVGARLIHMSTDCVFSGSKGMYTEAELPDATDVYGRSKLLGELYQPHTVTLRTSIIGHELIGNSSLLGWFLSQKNSTRGYSKAIFSGLPAIELAKVICDHVIPQPELHGVYHVSADPINKYELLKIISLAYGKDIEIIADEKLVIDRSLDSTQFKRATHYEAKSWTELVQDMRQFG